MTDAAPRPGPGAVLERARRSSELADSLASRGLVLPALRLAGDALALTWSTAIVQARARATTGSLRTKLAALGVSSALVREIVALRARLRSLDDDESRVGRDETRLLADVLRARARLARVIAAATRDRRQTRRIAGAVGLVVLALLGTAGWLRVSGRLGPAVRVEASAQYGHEPAFAPRNVADGYLGTEWLLPDATPGEIRISFARARRVERVVLVNSANLPYRDRATRAYRLELLQGERVVASHDGELGPVTPRPEPITVDVAADDVTAIVIHVDSWHGAGAGLAEVRAEPPITPAR